MTRAITTNHARLRQSQRNISDDEVTFVLEHGHQVRSGGALHVFLGRRDLRVDARLRRRYQHLEGAVLVLDDTAEDPVLITVYRNRHALKAIRNKAKYDHRNTQGERRAV